jgi:hypothetical protein
LKLNNEIVAAKFLLDDKLKKMQNKDKSVSLSTVDIYTELQKFGAFKTLELLLQISMTLPVTTASCERSFSCLKRVKNYLRSTMGHERLSSLALISIERDLSHPDSVDIEKVIDNFKLYSNKCRRILL